MVYIIIVIFEFNTCYSISYSVNNFCNNSISLLFYLMVYLVIAIFECNTCYSMSYSVKNICNNSISFSFFNIFYEFQVHFQSWFLFSILHSLFPCLKQFEWDFFHSCIHHCLPYIWYFPYILIILFPFYTFALSDLLIITYHYSFHLNHINLLLTNTENNHLVCMYSACYSLLFTTLLIIFVTIVYLPHSI
jgi:hypothetical protein